MEEVSSQLAVNENDRLKRYINESETIDELCDILGLARVIKNDDKVLSSGDVITVIREAENFLEDNLDHVVTGVIDKGPTYYRDSLSKKVNKIAGGEELGIRYHVKELLKQKMSDRFYQSKQGSIEQEIAKARTFQQLYDVIKQLRWISIERNIDEYYTPGEVIVIIQSAEANLKFLAQDVNLVTGNHSTGANIEDLLINIPVHSGINDRVRHLMFEYIKDLKLTNDNNNLKKPSLFHRMKNRLKK